MVKQSLFFLSKNYMYLLNQHLLTSKMDVVGLLSCWSISVTYLSKWSFCSPLLILNYKGNILN